MLWTASLLSINSIMSGFFLCLRHALFISAPSVSLDSWLLTVAFQFSTFLRKAFGVLYASQFIWFPCAWFSNALLTVSGSTTIDSWWFRLKPCLFSSKQIAIANSVAEIHHLQCFLWQLFICIILTVPRSLQKAFESFKVSCMSQSAKIFALKYTSMITCLHSNLKRGIPIWVTYVILTATAVKTIIARQNHRRLELVFTWYYKIRQYNGEDSVLPLD